MDQFVQDNEGTILLVGMLVALVFAATLEELLPRRKNSAILKQRWFNNIGLTLINQVGVNLLTSGVVIAAAWWGESVGPGLLNGADLGFWPMLILAFLIFEFISYWFHRALHAIPWLWRIHAIHHCDTEVDFTTTFRNHPLELFINAPLTLPVILGLGFPVIVVTAYQLIKTSISIVAHSNIQLSKKVDNVIRKFIITPDYHRLHHCSEQKFTDSNFSASIPLYDYLFGTALSRAYGDHKTMELGLEYFRDPKDSRIDRLLLMPFIWRKRIKKTTSIPPEEA